MSRALGDSRQPPAARSPHHSSAEGGAHQVPCHVEQGPLGDLAGPEVHGCRHVRREVGPDQREVQERGRPVVAEQLADAVGEAARGEVGQGHVREEQVGEECQLGEREPHQDPEHGRHEATRRRRSEVAHVRLERPDRGHERGQVVHPCRPPGGGRDQDRGEAQEAQGHQRSCSRPEQGQSQPEHPECGHGEHGEHLGGRQPEVHGSQVVVEPREEVSAGHQVPVVRRGQIGPVQIVRGGQPHEVEVIEEVPHPTLRPGAEAHAQAHQEQAKQGESTPRCRHRGPRGAAVAGPVRAGSMRAKKPTFLKRRIGRSNR